jgi:glucokinase
MKLKYPLMIIGVDLGGTNIRAALTDKGSIVSIRQQKLTAKDSLEGSLAQLASVIRPLLVPGLKGIGVGVPSVVDLESGIVYNVANIPSWVRVELKRILQEEFGVPVFINNDVNCLALGEHRYGSARGFRSFVTLALGTGLGAGIIVNNTLYAGSNCGAGEIGLLPYLERNFEFYTSSSFFESLHYASALHFHEEALKGDPSALNVWSDYGHHLGNLIKAVVYAYDPEAIVIGGSIALAWELFESSMQESLKDFAYPESMRKLHILRSETGQMALLGAAALVGE